MCLKMAIKCQKMVQMSWNLDQTCISMGFIKFLKIFEKFSKFGDFWPKIGHLARVSLPDIAPPVFTKNVQLKKLPKKRISETLIFKKYTIHTFRKTMFQKYVFSAIFFGHFSQKSGAQNRDTKYAPNDLFWPKNRQIFWIFQKSSGIW